ncbi:SubName: Full=Uncharacterized protein {ECO:0000313/EMBL:CCA74591.1} [Serendipita indica DSM 11827]|uniref:Uncharacterized protein n=1 Tax=Serendipita indica (strain DSM 11827) TaxID=1109443 RepID=G4TTE8_SERID|nr:SubName: Full=Uncharacterized protein {ECO:0000313/EMBL:CCA74591.1} [Serendipita indica DSM 11827]CCA74591.1 hypothetical protein PIIN_08543 [Serendipita indica DSM 11827]
MDHSPPYTDTLSSRSSSESIAVKTPSDSEHPSPPNTYIATKAAFPVLSSHFEKSSKRADSAPVPPIAFTRRRRETNSSLVSISSQSSQVSLLRKTLMLVTSSSSSSSSKPRSASMRSASGLGSERTPSLVTSTRRTSVSSLASTALSTPASVSMCPAFTDAASTLVDSPYALTADATTALSPTSISPSLAQFSPTPAATDSLQQFGIAHARSKTVPRLPEVRRKRSRARTTNNDGVTRNDLQESARRNNSSWFGTKSDLPSIARAIEPDTPTSSMGLDVPQGSQSRLGVPVSCDQIISPGHALAGTPRPEYPIQSSHTAQPPVLDKGKGKVTASTSYATLSCNATGTLDKKLSPVMSAEVRNGRVSLTTRRSPGSDSNLPTLEAVESGSRLMRSKIVCSTCGDVGPDFPRCGRCSEAWCSRECRVEANRSTGGKHRCAASVA